jgi:hypothetical protein
MMCYACILHQSTFIVWSQQSVPWQYAACHLALRWTQSYCACFVVRAPRIGVLVMYSNDGSRLVFTRQCHIRTFDCNKHVRAA